MLRRLGVEALRSDVTLVHSPHRRQRGILRPRAVYAFGQLGIVVANHARSSRQPLEELTAEELDLSFAVNARTTLAVLVAPQTPGHCRSRRPPLSLPQA